MKLYIATGNAHKVEEISAVLKLKCPTLEVYSAKALGGMPDVEEDGDTLEANSLIKANALKEKSPADAWVLADDTGLFVDALDGRPGIYAARYAGENCSFADNVTKMLGEMQGVPMEKRTAEFQCCLVLLGPDTQKTFLGVCPGKITEKAKGSEGFGYDPIFLPDGETVSFAELSEERKNEISHRGKALEMLSEWLKTLEA
jgi:XTP/dITP diphosphohydrolase